MVSCPKRWWNEQNKKTQIFLSHDYRSDLSSKSKCSMRKNKELKNKKPRISGGKLMGFSGESETSLKQITSNLGTRTCFACQVLVLAPGRNHEMWESHARCCTQFKRFHYHLCVFKFSTVINAFINFFKSLFWMPLDELPLNLIKSCILGLKLIRFEMIFVTILRITSLFLIILRLK